MEEYRFVLEKYNGSKTRYHCPKCNKKREFTRYIDTETGDYLNDNVGMCNRILKCGYHYTPKQYYGDNNMHVPSLLKVNSQASIKNKAKAKVSYIDSEYFNKSLELSQGNYLIDFLSEIWGYEDALKVSKKYFLGTSNHWQGATIFWQKDICGKIRTGKIMLYNATNGKRVKKPFNHIHWVHSVMDLPSYNLEQCLFGEHLLKKDSTKPVAIVESEKTAMIASFYMPNFIWLATGGVANLNASKLKVLKGRDVAFFPDIGCLKIWRDKIDKLSLTNYFNYKVADLLENRSTPKDREQGLDIADYLLREVVR